MAGTPVPAAVDSRLAGVPTEVLWAELAARVGSDLRWPPEDSGPAEVPEIFKAGFWDRDSEEGWTRFASGGAADVAAPGPVLAAWAEDADQGGLGRLSDDELIGVLGAAHRLTSWAAAVEIDAVNDLVRRRDAEAEASGDWRDAERVTEEVAAALRLTFRGADGLVGLAGDLCQLPGTLAALRAGVIDRYKAGVIAAETTGLSAAQRALVEQKVLGRAGLWTSGKLRAAVQRAVITADPAAHRRRKQDALKQARVEMWSEPGGTAALSGRDLPTADALTAHQYLSEAARQLKAAGVDGTMDQLRAKVFLTLLNGQNVESLLAADTAAGSASSGGDSAPGLAPAGSVNLTMPLGTWLGLSGQPGEVAGFRANRRRRLP